MPRQPGSGRARWLEHVSESDFIKIVLDSASPFGFASDLWTVGRLHQVITEKFHVDVSKNTIWRRLGEAELTYQKPEREDDEADEDVRKKWRRYERPKIKRCVLENKAILYFQDESNVSLTACLSQMRNPHRRRYLVVVMDRATPHTSQKTRIFIERQPRWHGFYLPPDLPNWNPDEKVWNHWKTQELKPHQTKTKDELHAWTQSKLEAMSKNPRLLRSIYFRCCAADFLG